MFGEYVFDRRSRACDWGAARNCNLRKRIKNKRGARFRVLLKMSELNPGDFYIVLNDENDDYDECVVRVDGDSIILDSFLESAAEMVEVQVRDIWISMADKNGNTDMESPDSMLEIDDFLNLKQQGLFECFFKALGQKGTDEGDIIKEWAQYLNCGTSYSLPRIASRMEMEPVWCYRGSAINEDSNKEHFASMFLITDPKGGKYYVSGHGGKKSLEYGSIGVSLRGADSRDRSEEAYGRSVYYALMKTYSMLPDDHRADYMQGLMKDDRTAFSRAVSALRAGEDSYDGEDVEFKSTLESILLREGAKDRVVSKESGLGL